MGHPALDESSLPDLFQAQLAIVLPDHRVALAGGVLKFLAVHDFHGATGVLDESLFLQNTRGQAHARPICSQHGCEEIMSDAQRPGTHSVLSHQQPARKALLNAVQPITSGGLCNLHTPNCDIAVQQQSKVWSVFQSILQSPHFYPKSVSRDLYHRPQRAPAQANHRRCSGKALLADYAGFGGSSIFHDDDKRNQTSIREIHKFQRSTRLAKDLMSWQIEVFQMKK